MLGKKGRFDFVLGFIIPSLIMVMATLVTYFTLLNVGFFTAYAETAVISGVDPVDYTFFGDVLKLIKAWGGLSGALKISAVITIIISSMKVSYFKKYWDALKISVNGQKFSLQILVVPVLSLVIGIAGQGKLSLEALVAYVIMGGGAVYIHEIMDFVKSLPIISPIAKVIVDVISFILGGKDSKPV